jgi:Uma2 family endonuclease
MTTARRLHHSYEEYLSALEVSGVKLEYCDGEIYAIAGGTPYGRVRWARGIFARPHAVTSPTLLVEVTSNSTEDYDRGEKLNHYRQCESVVAVLLVAHRLPQVTAIVRTKDGWEQHE